MARLSDEQAREMLDELRVLRIESGEFSESAADRILDKGLALADECLARGEEIAGLTATKDMAAQSAAAYSVRLEAARGLLEEVEELAYDGKRINAVLFERIAAFLAGKERPA